MEIGDCRPFLKTVARNIQPRWQEVAQLLGLTAEEYKGFEKKTITTWWPAYLMLVTWTKKHLNSMTLDR